MLIALADMMAKGRSPKGSQHEPPTSPPLPPPPTPARRKEWAPLRHSFQRFVSFSMTPASLKVKVPPVWHTLQDWKQTEGKLNGHAMP